MGCLFYGFWPGPPISLYYLCNFRSDIWPYLLLSVRGGFWWLWRKNLHKNIQSMLEFLKGPFLVLRFSYYILMTFLMMLSVILLSMLMILLSTLNEIRHLICGNNWNWLLNLNLIYETLQTGAGSGLLISMLKKLN